YSGEVSSQETIGMNIQVNTTSAAREPTIAINPMNPLNLVAGAIHFLTGTLTRLPQSAVYYSTNGGENWAENLITLTVRQKTFQRSGDPFLAVDTEGNFY